MEELVAGAITDIFRIIGGADAKTNKKLIQKINKIISNIIIKTEIDTKERSAKICELMVVGGRAWTSEQQIAADTLFAAAKNIRELK
jgi:hypothetical protein